MVNRKGKRNLPKTEFKKGNKPWNTGKKRPPMTEEQKRKIGDAQKGKVLSEETKQKISMSRKGNIPWNKGKKGLQVYPEGEKHPMYGRKHTEESKKMMSENHKGCIAWNKGVPCSEEVKQILKNANKGKSPWNKGKIGVQVSHRKGKTDVFSEETRHKLSEKAKGRKASAETRKKMSESRMGEKNHAWRGGTTFFPYCPKFNNQLKEKIRNRDDRTCQLCSEKENGQRLDVHHINHDRTNCTPQLIALCRRCHSKVTRDKNYYEALFMQKLESRGLID